jgi:hypothetical protein
METLSMTNATVRANARTSPKPTKSRPAALAKLYRPGVLERGLKIIAKSQDEATGDKDAAPTPKTTTAQDKYRMIGLSVMTKWSSSRSA